MINRFSPPKEKESSDEDDNDLDVEEAQKQALLGVDRVVVEVCCGEFSRISEKRNYVDDSCLCIRVTMADDLGQQATVRAITNVMKTYGAVISKSKNSPEGREIENLPGGREIENVNVSEL